MGVGRQEDVVSAKKEQCSFAGAAKIKKSGSFEFRSCQAEWISLALEEKRKRECYSLRHSANLRGTWEAVDICV